MNISMERYGMLTKYKIILLLISLSIVRTRKSVLTVSHSGDQTLSESCFEEIISEKVFKISYKFLDRDSMKYTLDGSLFFIRFKKADTTEILFSGDDIEGSRIFKNLGGFQMYSFCLENYSEKEIIVTFEITSGVDINDFDSLPLDV